MLYGALKNLSLEKVKILGNAFIDCQLNYVPLIWMFCRKTFCSKIEKLHHRTLKVIYGTIFYYAVTMSQFIKGIFGS